MSDWRRRLGELAGTVRDEVVVHAKVAREAVASVLGNPDAPVEIVAFRGFGSAQRVLVHGRVLHKAGVSAAAAGDSPWRNLLNMYRRIESDPVRGAGVRVVFAGHRCDVIADHEGFFEAWMTPREPLAAMADWHDASVELTAPEKFVGDTPPAATARVRIPGAGARFGVISDVDDTVLQSHVTNALQGARVALLGNAHTRLPFHGVAAFYRALEQGAGDGAPGTRNPIFYVSSSPWNLYDVIAEFLELQRIPAGPLLLRNWDLTMSSLGSSAHHSHKGAQIRTILERFPHLPFILIGDSGQQDPEIYAAAVREHPERILAVYIRDVTRSPERSAAMETLGAEVRAAGSTLVVKDDTIVAARHAAAQGWIRPEAVAEIEKDAASDEKARPPLSR